MKLFVMIMSEKNLDEMLVASSSSRFSASWLTVSKISRLIEIPKSTVNRHLYAMKSIGKICHSPGTPPLWMHNRHHEESETATTREMRLFEQLTKKGYPMSSHSIAWELGESKAVVNRMLYDLEKDGKVERLNFSPPIWNATTSDKNTRTRSRSRSRSLEELANESDDRNSSIRQVKERRRVETNEHAIDEAKATSSKKVTNDDNNDDDNPFLHAVQKCNEQQKYHKQRGDVDQKVSDKIAKIVWKKYRELQKNYGSSKSEDKEIIAGYVLQHVSDGNKDIFEVLNVGTGTKGISGEKYSLEGTVVHDCHAEIIARRSLLRWIYKQIATAGEPCSYAVRVDPNQSSSISSTHTTPFELRPFRLWLYCSQAPCGDGAVSSRSDPNPTAIPCFTTCNHGKFRFKIEAAGGCMVSGQDQVVQSFDGLQLGNRALCHSCSDKIAKRCVIGVQGALLAQLIPPLYMCGLVVSNVYSHSHLARALCCRSQRAIHDVPEMMQHQATTKATTFALHHPKIGHSPLEISRTEQRNMSRNKLSLNWTSGDNGFELIDSTTGRVSNGDVSRISKLRLYFLTIR